MYQHIFLAHKNGPPFNAEIFDGRYLSYMFIIDTTSGSTIYHPLKPPVETYLHQLDIRDLETNQEVRDTVIKAMLNHTSMDDAFGVHIQNV